MLTAPPRILTLAGSNSSFCSFIRATTEKASLISKRSMSLMLRPALAIALGIALEGAVVNHSGFKAALA